MDILYLAVYLQSMMHNAIMLFSIIFVNVNYVEISLNPFYLFDFLLYIQTLILISHYIQTLALPNQRFIDCNFYRHENLANAV
jgi:hypothetical protein